MRVTDSKIERWLREDIGHHDAVNDVPGEATGHLVATEPGVAAGLDTAGAVFEYLDVSTETPVENGTRLDAGERALTARGPAREVLRGERVAVNLAAHASGIATKTREAIEEVREGSDTTRVAATRKTTPGLRKLEKHAVLAGGGDTHRLDLSHMALVKDNQIAQLGFEEAIARVSERVSFATKIEVEVERPEDGVRAAKAGADIVLFDNLPPEAVAGGVRELPEETLSEASGAIGMDELKAYAETGVDVISMGELTHSAPALDFSFRLD